MVVTITLELSMISNKSLSADTPSLRMPTIGFNTSLSRMPNAFSNPNVINFSANWLRSASDGTITSNFSHLSTANTDSMVSVLPVPVGITTVAIWLDTFI